MNDQDPWAVPSWQVWYLVPVTPGEVQCITPVPLYRLSFPGKDNNCIFKQIITQHPVFQIFHVLVIAAAFVHYHGMANMAVYRWISSVNMVKWQSPQADKSWPVLCERDRAPCCGRHLASLWVFPSCRGFCDVMLWTVEQWTIANFALVQGPSRTMQFKWVWNSRDIFF